MPCAAATLEKIRHSLPPEVSLRVVSGRELGRTAHREAAEEPWTGARFVLELPTTLGSVDASVVKILTFTFSGSCTCASPGP